MPILANAKKALRQTKRKTLFNRPLKSKAKSMMDIMKKLPSAENLTKAFSAIDIAVKRNIFHKNKAARLKSQMSKLIAKAVK